MKPIDFRNEQFRHVQERVCAMKQVVWEAWLKYGPGTTREVALRSGIDILTFRPRSTDLFQIGAICLAGDPPSPGYGATLRGATEGVYRARTMAEWQVWFAEEQKRATVSQFQLI